MAKKKLSKKTKKVVKDNFVTAVAITSLLLNLFFIVGIIMYTSTNTIDEGLFSEAQYRYCAQRYNDNFADKAENGLEVAKYNIDCATGDFVPYFDEAASEYLNDLGY